MIFGASYHLFIIYYNSISFASDFFFEYLPNFKQFIPLFVIYVYWSNIKDVNGIITIVAPYSIDAGSWKHKDFPPPVGIQPNTSLPDFNAFIIEC